METLTLNKLDVARAAAKAYREGRLSAQGPSPECSYRDPSGYPCVIGAAIDDKTAAAWDGADDCKIAWLHGAGQFSTDNISALSALQDAHDEWAERRTDSARERLVALLNDILPPEERIDAALAACGEG